MTQKRVHNVNAEPANRPDTRYATKAAAIAAGATHPCQWCHDPILVGSFYGHLRSCAAFHRWESRTCADRKGA